MTCKRCGQEHSPNAWKLAVIITNGRNLTRTDYGEKTVCGLAAMIDGQMNTADLIPAVEELLKLWEDLYKETSDSGERFVWLQARKALKKAKGETEP
jgi:hypothetical protein